MKNNCLCLINDIPEVINGSFFNEEKMKLLCSVIIIDAELEKAILNAVVNNDQYTMDLNQERQGDLMDYIAGEANHEQKKRRQYNLDSLYLMIENEIVDEL